MFADATRAREPVEAAVPGRPMATAASPAAIEPEPIRAARTETALPLQPTGATDTVAPTFDIVRVTPQGNAVVAGRAEPFARVVVRDGERVLGETQADRNGEFVIVPERRVSAGGRELTLSSRGPNGRDVAGLDSVVVMVGLPPAELAMAELPAVPAAPIPAATVAAPPVPSSDAVQGTKAEVTPPPLVVLLPRDGAAPRFLQAPSKAQGLALSAVDYDQQGDIRFSGSAKPSAPVRVYVDNKPVGEASTDGAGQWTLTPPVAMPPGVHQLRVDEIARGGQVEHRVELPFQRTIAPVSGLSPGQMVVQPGSNLWRIARQTYGAGARYTVIYLANKEQIRDPNRIYPGQIFAMPTETRSELSGQGVTR